MSVLALLALQTSFLLPPFGYAVMMARTAMARPPALGASMRALAPFLGLQLVVLALTLLFPALTHLAQPAPATAGKAPLSDDEARQKLDRLVLPPVDADQ
jgi:TRAP-type mannitol/chloroaromatic compound transport system permease large subunit